MPAVVINGYTINVLRPPTSEGFTETPASEESDDMVYSLQGRMTGVIRWQKGHVILELPRMTQEDLDGLMLDIPDERIASCSGDTFGGAKRYLVKYDTRTVHRKGSTVILSVALRLIEA